MDEATQLHKNYMEDLHEKLKDLKGNISPFGDQEVKRRINT